MTGLFKRAKMSSFMVRNGLEGSKSTVTMLRTAHGFPYDDCNFISSDDANTRYG